MSDAAKKEDESLRGKRILWVGDPSDLPTMAIYMDDLMAAGGTVTLLTSVDKAIKRVEDWSSDPFDLIIYAMRMVAGKAFEFSPNAYGGLVTGQCFEKWLRAPTGGNLPSHKLPLLLYTQLPERFLEMYRLKPNGSHDRTVQEAETPPCKLIIVLTEMLVKVA